jgi:hypothetical protein
MMRLRRWGDEFLLEAGTDEKKMIQQLKESTETWKVHEKIAKALCGMETITMDEIRNRRTSLLLNEKQILCDQIQLAKMTSIHFNTHATCPIRLYYNFYQPRGTGLQANTVVQPIPDSYTSFLWISDEHRSLVSDDGQSKFSWSGFSDEAVEKLMTLKEVISFLPFCVA